VVDVFEEVDEQVRSDRYTAFVRRAWPWAAALGVLALLVVAGVWGFQAYQDHNDQVASQAYAKGLETLGRGELDAAYAQFGAAASSQSKAYAALSLMQQAGIRAAQHRPTDAVALFDQAAAAAPNPAVGDAARLKAVFVLFDIAPYATLEARLKPLLDSERPYKAQAREAMAMAKLKDGRVADARSDFVVLSLTPDATDDMRERARAALALIDSGSAAKLADLAKAAANLPPTPPTAAPAPAGAPDQSAPADPTSQDPTSQGPTPQGGAAQ
jgi:hypothetical protein